MGTCTAAVGDAIDPITDRDMADCLRARAALPDPAGVRCASIIQLYVLVIVRLASLDRPLRPGR
jgi:hypothetical protein